MAAIAALKRATFVFDGEVAVFDQQLRSRFELLREPDRATVTTTPTLIAAIRGSMASLAAR